MATSRNQFTFSLHAALWVWLRQITPYAYTMGYTLDYAHVHAIYRQDLYFSTALRKKRRPGYEAGRNTGFFLEEGENFLVMLSLQAPF